MTTPTPKVGTCYCGCGESTDRHFKRGHDARAHSMLDFLANRGDTAALLQMAGRSILLGTPRVPIAPC